MARIYLQLRHILLHDERPRYLYWKLFAAHRKLRIHIRTRQQQFDRMRLVRCVRYVCVCVRWCLTFQLISALGILLWRGAVGFSCVRGVREKMFSFWGLCFACVVCSVFVSIVLFSSLSVHKLGVDWASLHSLKLCTLEGRKTRRQSIIGQWSTYPINGVFKFRKPFNLRLILFVVCCNCCCDWDCTGDLLLCCENSCCGGCCVSNCCICCNCCSLLAAKRK